ncbi:helix-turn-helix domain-containing protein [Zhouia spongiae]|uniref:Helix-turn-helix domain-containing protein n=1 Tax=Zhouia spongiae TaxID=2202721 RepID=A0ABY3YLQ2_9FLAO|nr:helix-turn-helix domain-containing protein [Zhouia spongiae]UNY98545.1 helix-turn-helix domain-containing protein [Zhouia spongiae]
MVYLIGIIISAFLSFLLLTKKNKSIADKILFIWLFVTTLHLTIFAFKATERHFQIPHLLGIEILLPLVHGPFLFLYITAFSVRPLKISYSLLHFIPFVLAVLLALPFLLLDIDAKILVYQNDGRPFQIHRNIIFIATLLSGTTYCLLSLYRLYRHKKKVKDIFSYTEKIDLQWLFYLTVGLSGIWMVSFFAADKYTFISVVLYVLFIGYYGIKQVGIFTNQQAVVQEPAIPEPSIGIKVLDETPPENVKYENSSLSEKQIQQIHTNLHQLMQREKPHCTPGLTLPDLAKQLNVHPNTLSQVINSVEQKNFFDYINTLRVEEFKTRAVKTENQKYTMLSLAYECGFNSKTSFNRNFRNITGQSPTEYLKHV